MVPGLGAAGLTGCMADPQDARMRVPGEYIGTFEVRAALTDSTCGPGTLEAAGLWEFEVQLSNDKDCLYWNSGGDSVCGAQSSNRETFSFKSEGSWTLLESKPGRPGCVIWRQDIATGTWKPKDDERFVAFDGKLSYAYAPGVGSVCDDQLAAAELTTLPCLVRYDLSATRKDD